MQWLHVGNVNNARGEASRYFRKKERMSKNER